MPSPEPTPLPGVNRYNQLGTRSSGGLGIPGDFGNSLYPNPVEISGGWNPFFGGSLGSVGSPLYTGNDYGASTPPRALPFYGTPPLYTGNDYGGGGPNTSTPVDWGSNAVQGIAQAPADWRASAATGAIPGRSGGFSGFLARLLGLNQGNPTNEQMGHQTNIAADPFAFPSSINTPNIGPMFTGYMPSIPSTPGARAAASGATP